MRLAPVAIRHWRDDQSARQIADAQSRTTHFSDISAGACELTAALLARLISGQKWDAAVLAPHNPYWHDAVKEVDPAANWPARSRDSIRSSGFVLHTLEAALWAVDTTSSFDEAVLRAVNLGDDADSVGAVAGQLAGARYGLSGIPTKWRQELLDEPKIERLGRALFSARASEGNHDGRSA